MTISDLPVVVKLLKAEYKRRYAPVVQLGEIRTDDPFRTLVTTILSARTKDETTIAASERLFTRVKTPSDLGKLSVCRIEKLIFPAGFYRTKAKHLKLLPGVMQREFGGRVPDNIEDLCRLPGVGRKTANLVVSVAFRKPGICVDVHVHRICNRFGLLRTKSPYETEMRLRKILPPRYWSIWNEYLVSHGQTICRPVGPRCGDCTLTKWCARVGVSRRAPVLRRK